MDTNNQNQILSSSKNFEKILNDFEQDSDLQNLDLDRIIIIWCNKLAIDKHFSRPLKNIQPVSEKIKENAIQWSKTNIASNFVFNFSRIFFLVKARNIFILEEFISNIFKFFYGEDSECEIEEYKKKMNGKTLIVIGFILTGIGLLIFLLQQNKQDESLEDNNLATYSFSDKPEKYTLLLLINVNANMELFSSLRESDYLKPENVDRLYKATQALWIDSQSQYDLSLIKKEWDSFNSITNESDYDVFFVRIELDGINPGFQKNANQLDRIDAFNSLANSPKKVTVSPRFSSRVYQNTEFYSR